MDEYDAFTNQDRNPFYPKKWPDTEALAVLKGFWSVIKGSQQLEYGIKRVFITGATPLLLQYLTSGAGDHENMSFCPNFSAMCGLTQLDVISALKTICKEEKDVQEHLQLLTLNASGYHFCRMQRVETVFNTQTVISYLEVRKQTYCLSVQRSVMSAADACS